MELYLKSCIKTFIDSGAVMFMLFSFSLLAIGGQPLAFPCAAGSSGITATNSGIFHRIQCVNPGKETLERYE